MRHLIHFTGIFIIIGIFLIGCDAVVDSESVLTKPSSAGVGGMATIQSASSNYTLWFQGFEEDKEGWFDFGAGSVHRETSGYLNDGGYADGIPSASGNWHGRLRTTQIGGCIPPFSQNTSCGGPFTRFGGPYEGTSAADGWQTSIDIYLDVDWATNNTDWRFDWSVALNTPNDYFLRDFVFNVGTSPTASTAEFVVSASNNARRSNSYPSNPGGSPVIIDVSGWYTFQHKFSNSNGELVAELTILDDGGQTVGAWLLGGDAVEDVGRIRYGWFVNQEIHDLAVDNLWIADPQELNPQTIDDCKKGGWQQYGFRNQGLCIQFVNTGKDSRK